MRVRGRGLGGRRSLFRCERRLSSRRAKPRAEDGTRRGVTGPDAVSRDPTRCHGHARGTSGSGVR